MTLLHSVDNFLFQNRYISYGGYRLHKYIKNIANSIERDAKVLDAGAGQCQYKKYFKHTKYTSQDLSIGDKTWDFNEIDIHSEIYEIPVEDGSFDYILCTEVLEHLKYPNKAFCEFSRILKPGGKLFMTVPLIWEEHQQPYDYFRYTQYSLKNFAEENNFQVELMEKQGGAFICIARLFIALIPILFLNRFSKKEIFLRKALFILLYPLNLFIGFLFYYLDTLDKEKNLTTHYECIFVKK